MAEPAPKRARVDDPCLCSYAAVSAHFRALLPGESQAVDAAPVAVRAQVVHKRQLSAKLVFIDLRFEPAERAAAAEEQPLSAEEAGGAEGAQDAACAAVAAGGAAPDAEATTLEAILKPRGAVLPLDGAKALRHALHLGDRARLLVCAERLCAEKGGALVLHICDAAVELAWASVGGGRCFQPDKSWHVPRSRGGGGGGSGGGGGGGGDVEPAGGSVAGGRGTARAPSAAVVLESGASASSSSSSSSSASSTSPSPLPAAAAVMGGAGSQAPPGPGVTKVGDGAVAELELCKFFINTGACERGEGCPWRHPPPHEIKQARALWVAARRARKGGAARLDEDPHATGDKREKSRRAAMFVAWLVDTFGEARLRGGTGVLDIAGGRGDVSFELANVCDPPFPCLLVEPRPRKLSKPQRRALAKSGRADGVRQVQAMLDDELLATPDFGATFAAASALVGMHPDQATEPIVDQALARGKPFAVVPCCVFAREAAAAGNVRRTPEGKEVSTYEELVDYLAAKDLGIRRAYLGFRGRNCVLYKL
jgi:hypothetical protein